MSRDLNTVAVEQFDTEVKHDYQGMAVLDGCTTVRMGIEGDTYDFRRIGKGQATERTGPSQDVIPMNIDHGLIQCNIVDWEAPEYTDIFDQAAVNFDEIQELAMTIKGAMGRRRDQSKINAMAAGTYSATPTAQQGGLVGTDIGGAGTGLNIDKLRRAKKYLDDREVPMTDRFALITSEGLEQLLGSTQITSADFNSVRALVQGEVDTFLGFKFKTIGIEREEGGLNKTGALQDSYFFHKMSIGYAEAFDIDTRVDWVSQKQSWLAIGIQKHGAVVRDNEGIVRVQYTVS